MCSAKDGKAVCSAGGIVKDDTTCDDGDDDTSNDTCFDGVCSGTNLCEQNQVQCKVRLRSIFNLFNMSPLAHGCFNFPAHVFLL